MIVIVRGEEKKKVPVSTYNNFFKAQGWVLEGEETTSPEPIPVKEEKKPEPKVEPVVEEPEKEEVVEEPDEEISEEDWDDALEELQDDEVEKPLSEMNKQELLEKAKKMGIKVPANSSNKQIRDLIKASK